MSAQAVRIRRVPLWEQIVFSPFALCGWLILRLLFLAADLASDAYEAMDRPSWSDIIGGVIFIPIAFGIVFTLMLGRGAIAHWLSLL